MKNHIIIFILFLFILISCNKDKGILDHSNFLQDWQLISNTSKNGDFNKIFFTDQKIGWMIGDDGNIFKTENGGNSWYKQNSNITKDLKSIFFINKNQGWISGLNNTFLHTSDGGKNWQQINIYNDTTKHNTDIYFANNKNGWLINNYGEIYKTNDSGNSWKEIYTLPDMGWSKIKFIDNLFGYAVKFYGNVLMKTNDGGKSWDETQLFVPNSKVGIMVKDIEIINKNISYYAYSWCSGGILETATPIMKTTNGCNTWTLQDSIMNPYLRYLHFIDEENGCIAGSKYIYSTDNGGQTWHCAATFSESDLIVDIFFYNNKYGWALSRNGNVFKNGY